MPTDALGQGWRHGVADVAGDCRLIGCEEAVALRKSLERRALAQRDRSILFGMAEASIGKAVKASRDCRCWTIPRHPGVNIAKNIVAPAISVDLQRLIIFPGHSVTTIRRSPANPLQILRREPSGGMESHRRIKMSGLNFGEAVWLPKKTADEQTCVITPFGQRDFFSNAGSNQQVASSVLRDAVPQRVDHLMGKGIALPLQHFKEVRQ